MEEQAEWAAEGELNSVVGETDRPSVTRVSVCRYALSGRNAPSRVAPQECFLSQRKMLGQFFYAPRKEL